MAKVKVFFQELPEDKRLDLIEQLKIELKEEVDILVENGNERDTAEAEIIDDYLNTHDYGIVFEI